MGAWPARGAGVFFLVLFLLHPSSSWVSEPEPSRRPWLRSQGGHSCDRNFQAAALGGPPPNFSFSLPPLPRPPPGRTVCDQHPLSSSGYTATVYSDSVTNGLGNARGSSKEGQLARRGAMAQLIFDGPLHA